ncbi:MAG: uracil-DNA glycosylase, partial [Bacteroidota bacterium]
MPDTNDELRQLLTNIETILKEERELFGEYLSTDPVSRQDGSASHPTSSSAPSTDPMSPKKKTAAPHGVKEEIDLFGKPVIVKEGETSVRTNLLPYPDEPWTKAKTLAELNEMICTCMKCPLGQTRTKFVFGVGNPDADVVVVGEAPGADEDAKGEPFVGRAGQLLNKILEAIHFKREEVFICNILKCRPPNNRDPLAEEVDSCEPHLWKQLEILKPKMILCLGRIAGQTLLRTTETLGSLRGRVHDYRGIPLMVTYHPAALLRNPNWKRPAWEDVQQFRKLYDEMK